MFILAGVFFIAFGIIDLFRFPDFYTKLHAASVVECCGGPFCFVDLAVLQINYIGAFKLIIIATLIFLLNPVSIHALGKASLLYKVEKKGRIK